ncbi:MAG: T9SS type A sorting domain-containing protein [Muribaculaceae bacterium]|jgi:hypothetical protein|nr:T9SS type A sorting domain-containing protein [Muribaculaceae bacterium]
MIKKKNFVIKIRMIAIAVATLSFASAIADNVLTSTSDQTVSGQTYSSTTTDQSAVKVTAGTLTITKCKITNSANASSTDNASFYGTNAVMLCYGAKTTPVISSSNNYVSGTGRGANGIFAYGTGVITTSNDTIVQTGGNARAIMASGGGTITVNNDVASTTDASSSMIATDRGGGTITVNGGSYTANGQNSAGIYSTGAITANDATFLSNGGEIYVIEGSNSITANNCSGTSKYNKWGILMYQSFSGDATGSTGTMTITGGSLNYSGTKGGLFYNTNATAKIYLNGVTITNACDTLVRSLKGGWGNNATASYGGTTYITASGQTMEGMMYADANSKQYITLSNSTAYTNAKINPGNVASLVTLTIDDSSTLSLASDCYINGAITFATAPSTSTTIPNISGNGHCIYYTSSTNSALGGGTFKLTNGGYLCPAGSGVTSVLTGDQAAKVEIFNISGQKVYSDANGTTSTTENQEILNNLDVANGLYIVRAIAGNSIVTTKMIKK